MVTKEELLRSIDLYIMSAGPYNYIRGEMLFDILEHCGEMVQLLDAMPKKGENKLFVAVEHDQSNVVDRLEAKWLKRFDAFRLAQREKSPANGWSRANKMTAALKPEANVT